MKGARWIRSGSQTADGRFTASLVEPGPSGVRFDPFWLVEGPEDFEAVNVGSLEEARDLLARLARRRTYPKVSARGSVRPATLALGRACDGFRRARAAVVRGGVAEGGDLSGLPPDVHGPHREGQARLAGALPIKHRKTSFLWAATCSVGSEPGFCGQRAIIRPQLTKTRCVIASLDVPRHREPEDFRHTRKSDTIRKS